jgi:hypothetical protein
MGMPWIRASDSRSWLLRRPGWTVAQAEIRTVPHKSGRSLRNTVAVRTVTSQRVILSPRRALNVDTVDPLR